MYVNTAKKMMLEGKPALGCSCGTSSFLIAEAMALAGYDFVLLDDQHGLWDPNTITAAFKCIRLAGSVPMARVQKNDFGVIGAMLDRGAMGIVVPLVNTVDEAKAAAYAVRYPPRGGRSFGPYGCASYGSDYAEWVDDEVFLAVQIESQQAIEHVEQIMAVPGVDGCWIGPVDLGRSMGVDLSKPDGVERHQAAIRRTLAACTATSKIPGIALGPMKDLIAQGFLFLTPGSDLGLIQIGAREQLQSLRS